MVVTEAGNRNLTDEGRGGNIPLHKIDTKGVAFPGVNNNNYH